MRVFLLSSLLLTCAWVLHLVIWRVKLPRHHIRALMVIFGTVLGCWLVVAVCKGTGIIELVRVCGLYVSVTLSYVITYSAVEGDSPTLSFMRLLSRKGGEGLDAKQIDDFVARRPFVATRLAALADSGLVREENGRYLPGGRPSFFFRLILEFRKLYGPISKGG